MGLLKSNPNDRVFKRDLGIYNEMKSGSQCTSYDVRIFSVLNFMSNLDVKTCRQHI